MIHLINFELNGNTKFIEVEIGMLLIILLYVVNISKTAISFMTLDTNNRRKRKLQKENLKYRYVKDNAYLTIFPNCAKYLSQRKLAEGHLGSSLVRAETSANREEAKRLHDIELCDQ